ncbi:hypothetical protein BV898_04002 [Hypsibius exemplaris]|uniref:ZP domain-containing protein n=1 Tax=Hypsibius exemplaris TaxID=2072580 RepID=A0A1W0X3T4_HYPEX|nr:hypothetical protein BV898_04002 [Hypsibius exemplaris]
MCFFVLVRETASLSSGTADSTDDTPAVRVNCKTPGLMLFQIYEPKVRSLLKSPTAKELVLFSEEPRTKLPLPNCMGNHTIGDSAGWSKTFSFLTYGGNSSCMVKSYLIDQEDSAQQTFVADIFIKVFTAEDRVGQGRRGKVRLSCTMLAAQQVESARTNLRTEIPVPSDPILPVRPRNPEGHAEIPLEVLTSQLEGSLMLRFFKLVPGSNFPVPAVSVTEGEDIYLVAALRSGGSFAVLRPMNCTIRSVVSSPQKASSLGELVHSQPGAGNTFIKEFSVLDNGCQSAEHPWETPEESTDSGIFRLYYTRFLAPTFSGSLKLSAKCSINLCTQQNSKACIEQPKSLLEPGCFSIAKNVPNFQFHSETITNISEVQPANILMMMSSQAPPAAGPPPTRRFVTAAGGTVFRSAVPSTASSSQTVTSTTTRTTETKENNGIFKRNITADPRRKLPQSATMAAESVTAARTVPPLVAAPTPPMMARNLLVEVPSPPLTEPSRAREELWRTVVSMPATPQPPVPVAPPNKSPEQPQEVKYCFMQRTVTLASASVAVVLILSVVLVSFSLLLHCRGRRRRDRAAILDD